MMLEQMWHMYYEETGAADKEKGQMGASSTVTRRRSTRKRKKSSAIQEDKVSNDRPRKKNLSESHK